MIPRQGPTPGAINRAYRELSSCFPAQHRESPPAQVALREDTRSKRLRPFRWNRLPQRSQGQERTRFAGHVASAWTSGYSPTWDASGRADRYRDTFLDPTNAAVFDT